jgi:adenine phosphoribosyltransferase
MNSLLTLIRDVPDFPKPGVVFKDIGPLLADPTGFEACITALSAPWKETAIDAVCGIESRGFIFGAAMALAMKTASFRCARSASCRRRPWASTTTWSTAVHVLKSGRRGWRRVPGCCWSTMCLPRVGRSMRGGACWSRAGAKVVGAAVVIEIDVLRGRVRWPDAIPLRTLLRC